MTKNPVPPHPFHSMRGARIWLEEKHMTKILKIGLVAGVNPIVAPFVKAAIFRAAAESARTVELVEDELELRKDAPTERIALGDSKITALESAWRLQEKGCDVALIANLRSEAYIDEVRTELQMPIVSLYAGMPEAVKKYIETNDANAVREVQKEIINAYEKDISKHAPTEQVVRINQVWNSIPSQLAKENKKFIYGVVKPGARAKDYEMAIQWLIDAGLVYKISRVKMLGIPLKIHEDISAFKLFILDCGLLGAMSKTPPALLLLPNNDNTGKGDFTENFVCSQIETLRDIPIYYYSKENSQLELDFVLQIDTHVVPVEVKAEENLQAKSLKTTLANHPGMQALRFSMNDYRKQDNITNVPLYGVRSFLREMVNS